MHRRTFLQGLCVAAVALATRGVPTPAAVHTDGWHRDAFTWCHVLNVGDVITIGDCPQRFVVTALCDETATADLKVV